MQQKPANQPRPKAGHPTVLGALLFTLFNLILLSLISWILLEIGFFIKIIYEHSDGGRNDIQYIVKTNLNIIQNNSYFSSILEKFSIFKTTIYNLSNGHIGANVIEIFLGSIEIVLTRIFIFTEWIPFMIMILCILTVDGLVLRDIRKFQGSRESTFIFHRLKPLAKFSFYSLFLIYMAIPYCVSPFLFLFPMAGLSSWFISLSIKNFKKYL